MKKEHKNTAEEERQNAGASVLKKSQENGAVLLKQEQHRDALNLSDWQGTHNDENLTVSRKSAAGALKKSQEEAAQALEKSQGEDAATLKEENKTSKRKLFEKDRIISWLTGGYSVEKDSE